MPFLSAWYLLVEVVVRNPMHCPVQKAGMLSASGQVLPLATGKNIPRATVYVLSKEQSWSTLDQMIECQPRLCYLSPWVGGCQFL